MASRLSSSRYLDLLRQRDLPNWGLPAAPQTTLRLLRMLASGHGQEWNASQIGKSLGLSYHTVDSYLDYLVGAFLFRRLEAYHANIRKRLVKRPKIYWRDTGLLHSILNVENADALLSRLASPGSGRVGKGTSFNSSSVLSKPGVPCTARSICAPAISARST